MASSFQQIEFSDFYPERGTYRPKELVRLFLECETETTGRCTFVLQIFNGLQRLEVIKNEATLQMGHNIVEFSWQPPDISPAGYGAEITFENVLENPGKIKTAFDVLPGWTAFPRYGFVCDFSRGRSDEDETIQTLAKYHINGLQFYDWQYRHDDLVPPQDDYLDPLGRPLSLKVTRKLIDAAHQHGMVAMPYLAIYAASAAFWKAHPTWMLYDSDQKPIPFGEDFLGIMNPTPDGPWQKHLLAECNKVNISLSFDGLHVDQYGDPKTGLDVNMQTVDIPESFNDFVCKAVVQHPGKPVLFNAVGNWPIDTLAASPTAFNYIEIWPPEIQYTDIIRIVRNARRLSGEKPVVIALYLPASRTINNQLADALIFSAGGTRIELGEKGRLLSDPYFPKHEHLSDELNKILRRQLDLIIRYEEWFGPLIREIPVSGLKIPAGIEAFFRKTQKGASLCLVNLRNPSPLCWNEEHTAPEILTDFEIEINHELEFAKIWMISPDLPSTDPISLNFVRHGNRIVIDIPVLKIWNILLFE